VVGKGPEWKLGAPAASRPRRGVRALLTAGAITVGVVCASAPLAACNYKACSYDDGRCYQPPDLAVPVLDGGVDGAPDLEPAPDDGSARD